jgi:hypothetical protein
VSNLSDATAIASGDSWTCAVHASGEVVCWGQDGGEDNIGPTFDSSVPISVPGFGDNAGQTCTGNDQCSSGFCVDGMCCKTACGRGDPTDCQACSTDAGGTANGTCTAVVATHVCYTAQDLCSSIDQSERCTGSTLACPVPAQWPTGSCESVPSAPNTPIPFNGGDTTTGGMTVSFPDGPPPSTQLGVIGPPNGSSNVCPLPAGFESVQIGGVSQIWDVKHPADWPPGTTLKVCVAIPPELSDSACSLQLMHGTDSQSCGDAGTGTWQSISGMSDICTGTDNVACFCPTGGCPCKANTICGQVTSASPFALVRPAPGTAPTIAVPAGLTVEATGPSGAAVSYSAQATDPKDGSLTPVCTPASGSTFPLGTTPVTCKVTDAAGISNAASFNVTVRDTTGPILPHPTDPLVAYATSTAGAKVNYATPTATDAVDGGRPVSCAPASGSTFNPGKTLVTCRASDTSTNTSTTTFTVWVEYQAPLDGTFFLQPINPAGSSIFKQGSTIPVKFKLLGASAGITNLAVQVLIAKVSNSVTGTYVEAVSTGKGDSGNAFRYDPTCGQYIFNLSTKSMTTGTWSLRADLGDGVDHSIGLSLR